MLKHGSISEIAKLTNFPPTRLRQLVKNGDIASVKIGTKYIVTVEAVEQWLRGEKKQKGG